MAAKENFFKAMKELTGMGSAEDTSKQVFSMSSASAAEAVVKPIWEKADKPLFERQSGESMVQDTMQEAVAQEEPDPSEPPQSVGNGFLGNWPLQQDKPQQEEPPQQPPDNPQPPAEPKEPQGPASTVISASMIITGEVKSTGDLEILGMIKGPVITTGNITIEGKILGNIEGNDIILKGCAVQGNINATGNVNMDTASVVVGDLRAINLVVNGKIKGNLTVQERIDLNKEAIVDGNASSRFVSMSQGARLNGNVSVSADSSEDETIFDIRFDI